jgi:hypothetical protein
MASRQLRSRGSQEYDVQALSLAADQSACS